MNYLTVIFLAVAVAFACKNTTKGETDLEQGTEEKYFGDKIDETGAISYEELLTKMATSDSIEVKVEGKVSGVCQTKGCWMDIVSAVDTSAESMFVQFKDYAFFMPKDLAGKSVVMEGKAYREITSVDDLKHFAEDEGKTPEEIEKITEPIVELKFMASGVKIKD